MSARPGIWRTKDICKLKNTRNRNWTAYKNFCKNRNSEEITPRKCEIYVYKIVSKYLILVWIKAPFLKFISDPDPTRGSGPGSATRIKTVSAFVQMTESMGCWPEPHTRATGDNLVSDIAVLSHTVPNHAHGRNNLHTLHIENQG